MFTVGLMVVCTIYVDIIYDGMAMTQKINSAYGTITKVVDDQTAITDFQEYLKENKLPRIKPVGDYSAVEVNAKDCIPF